MSQPAMEMDPQALREHARAIDQWADKLDQATSAAGQIATHHEVYGLFAGPYIVPLMDLVQGDAIDELRSTTDAIMQLSDAVRSVAYNTEVTDGQAAHSFWEAGA
ncbi:type VII secretion target [Salinispora vitiensis]|uniref:type VII secretion target n=1 Tax=Salinispora vitiensis TaxID=999544 RepID=UPI00039ACDAC|nr:type VII secretion target [Salinispora vitiensis]